MKPKSHTLFHFTQSVNTLKLIMKNGFWPKYCLEDVRWLGYEVFDFIAYPMVCFCDIPLSRADEHVNFYGDFGIGMTRQWAERNKLTPILYISENNNFPKTFRDLVDYSVSMKEEKRDEAKKTVRYILAHSKPTEGNIVVGNDVVKKEFYQESEWRCVPKSDKIVDYLSRKDFDDEEVLLKCNELTREHCILPITPNDIKYIFVKSDSEIPDIINYIQTELDHFPNADIKVLMSRVTSLESIRCDI